VIFENRLVPVMNGTISDMIPAFGSQVYLIGSDKTEENTFSWPGNLLKDPGFEDITSPGVPSACYARTESDRGATFFLDSREHLEGNHSLRIVTPSEGSSVTLRFFPVPVKPGSSYLISVWTKSDPDQRFSPRIQSGRDINNSKTMEPQYVEISMGEYGKARFVPQREWKQFVTIINIPADSVDLRKTNIILRMPGHGVAWFDMLQVIEDPLKR
jgi:hypothetical protein